MKDKGPGIRTYGASSHAKLVRFAMEMLDAGEIGGVSTEYESTTGLGRVAAITIDGQNLDLLFDNSDSEATPPTAPGKGQKKDG